MTLLVSILYHFTLSDIQNRSFTLSAGRDDPLSIGTLTHALSCSWWCGIRYSAPLTSGCTTTLARVPRCYTALQEAALATDSYVTNLHAVTTHIEYAAECTDCANPSVKDR
jgi:hypothetical protein